MPFAEEEKYSPIKHLASILWPPWIDRAESVLVMLSCVFDAGGDEHTPLLTVAGFASSVEAWDDFSRLWKARLDRDGIEFFHAVDLAACRGPFKHWRERPDREDLKIKLSADLMDILKRHVFRKFAHTVINKDFVTLSPELREKFALTAYSLGGRTCDKGVREWMRQEPGFRGKPYEIVFEAGDRGKGKLQKRLMEDYRTFPIFKPKKDTVMEDGSTQFGFIPLQAADWLAYEVNLTVQKFGEGTMESESQLRWPMQEFLRYPPGFMGYYMPENIKIMEMGIEVQKKIIEWEKAIGLDKNKKPREPRKE